MRIILCLSLLLTSFLTGCGDDDPDPVGPCDGVNPPEGCGGGCASHADCPTGLYCGATGCTADCTAENLGLCNPGEICDVRGRCAPEDGGIPLADGGDCPHVDVSLQAVEPEVLLLIDQSSSMEEDFGEDGDRWEAMVEALVGQNGVVRQLQNDVRFGATLYTGPNGGDGPVCPLLEPEVPAIAIDNFDAIEALLRGNGPLGETPTGDSIDAVVESWPQDPDAVPFARVIVLATDGEPDTCEEPNPQNGQRESRDAVENAYALGIRTFVLSVGSEVGEDHLQDLANLGVGLPLPAQNDDEDARYYTATNPTELQAAFEDIIGQTRSCLLSVEGTLDIERASEGQVELNGVPLVYGDPNGWRVVDENTIELVGDACTTYLESDLAALVADFPCDVVFI